MNAQQLKNSILQEAIEGRLVPQDPNDEPASVLLDKIRKEKARLVKEGKLKKKDLEETPIEENEIPFKIPKSWEWCRVGTVAEYVNGLAFKPEDWETSGLPIIRIQNLTDYNKPLNYTTKKFDDKFKVENGDLLFSWSATLDSFIWKGQTAWLNQHIFKVNPRVGIFKGYLYYALKAIVSNLSDITHGLTMKHLTRGVFENYSFPLPPLAEQKRIVAKIEELLPKVEEYGKAQEALDKLNEELPERLKKSILQEAITGRLVPQDPNDEPASVLLDKIRTEKKQLVKEGKLKKKDLEETPISEDEISFKIPENWEWCRLGDIGIFERGNGIKRDETLDYGYPCVRYGEMYTKYKYAPTFDRTFSFTNKSVFDKCRKAHKGDLFMALTGENKQDISLAAQYIGEEEIAVGGDLCHFTILEAFALYFVYLINSKYFSNKKELLATGDIIVHISTDKLASIAIPLPPLAEQKRIVAKIEQLMKEIDKLKV